MVLAEWSFKKELKYTVGCNVFTRFLLSYCLQSNFSLSQLLPSLYLYIFKVLTHIKGFPKKNFQPEQSVNHIHSQGADMLPLGVVK